MGNLYLWWFGAPVFIYQILTARMISQIYGDLFLTQLLIIAISYFGHAMGSVIAHRWRGSLPLAHLSLAICNVLLLVFWHEPVWSAAPVYVLFFAISFFSALLFPLFYQRFEAVPASFNKIYFGFHLLIVLLLPAMDLLAIGTLGIQKIFAGLLVSEIFWGLYWWRNPGIRKPQPVARSAPPSSLATSLFLFSMISGVAQGLLYRQVQTVLEPLAFHYSLFIAALMAGWALCSAWFYKKPNSISWDGFKNYLPLTIAGLLFWSLAWTWLWSYWLDLFFAWDGSSLTARVIYVFGLVLPAAFTFGSLMPLVQREAPAIPIGRWLGVNSAGNMAGLLIYIAVIFPMASGLSIWISLFVIAAMLLPKSRAAIKPLAFATLPIAGIAFLSMNYNWSLGSYFYRSLQQWQKVSAEVSKTELFRSYGSQLSLVTLKSEDKMLFMNGHYSVYIPAGEKVSPADVMMGLPALHYTAEQNRALLIGLGTGFTAMGPAKVFNQLDIVDIDPTMTKLTSKLAAKESFQQPNVKFIEADGLTYLRRHLQKYDLIINNVPSPVYFASGKLWTREAFQAISESLNNNGVFFQWLSAEFNERELPVVWQTMRDYFPRCDLYTLGYHFHGLVCAKNTAKELKFSEAPAEKLAPLLNMSASDYLKLLANISFHDIELPAPAAGTPFHTLDQPYLEMLTSQRPPGWSREQTTDEVVSALGIPDKLRSKLNQQELFAKCHAITQWLGFDTEMGPESCKKLGLN